MNYLLQPVLLATVIALAVLHRCQRNGFPFNAKETQVCEVGQGKGRSWLGRVEGGGDTNCTTEESWEGKPVIYILFMEDTHTHTHTHRMYLILHYLYGMHMQEWTKLRNIIMHRNKSVMPPSSFKHFGYDVLWLSKGVECNTITKICVHDW